MSLVFILVVVEIFLLEIVLSAGKNNTNTVVECMPASNATDFMEVCSEVLRVNEARRQDEQQSYSMLIQGAYGLIAITILIVAYFVFRTMRLRRKTHYAANTVNRRRKPGNVEMQRLTEEQFDDDDETVMYARTDDVDQT